MKKQGNKTRKKGHTFYIGEENHAWLVKKTAEEESESVSFTLRKILKKLRAEEEKDQKMVGKVHS